MKFNTRYDYPKTEPQDFSSHYEKTYHYVLDSDNNNRKTLVEDGRTDIWTPIQERYESTKIENILNRAMWDPSVLQAPAWDDGDYTEMPTTLRERQSRINDVKDMFIQLPAEIRSKFNHSVEQFVSEYGTEEFINKLSIKQSEPTATETTNE